MTTTLAPPTTPPHDAERLIVEIEQYLATQAARTPHPLISKTTQQLVGEALATIPAATPAPPSQAPAKLWRLLPDWTLPALRPLHGTIRRRPVTTAQHLQLTALLLEQWGWDHTPNRLRTPTGRRCILGAQTALHHLGYGDDHTARRAGDHIQATLTSHGIREPYWRWNDHPSTTATAAITLVRQAATTATL